VASVRRRPLFARRFLLHLRRAGPFHAAVAWCKIFDHYMLTVTGVEAYITRTRRAVRVTARWRACEAPHF